MGKIEYNKILLDKIDKTLEKLLTDIDKLIDIVIRYEKE